MLKISRIVDTSRCRVAWIDPAGVEGYGPWVAAEFNWSMRAMAVAMMVRSPGLRAWVQTRR